ncbi:G-type lectin S-receptor-like serine/threonine-protein kinase LECRK3 [Phragmites australis]|uniref:G-type lectin S-receptor-like serine/threonine-protein kinase LECRK3 n=1 Tax=Phragmites australis TaxID=29695 RepID=UPI002D799504|nr:G-type lectin S-receptor-like serine/threonine-protein kinase LECRK3 [Phragmites australis]
MAALPCFAVLRLVPLLAMLVQQARLLPVAVARTNLTAGISLTPPGYITSPSGGFAFGFRALDFDPTKFLLATWFRFRDDGGGGNSSSQLSQSVVWFAKQSPYGTTPVATAQSVLSITVDGKLTLTDVGNQVLWSTPTPSLNGGSSVLELSDSGNLQFLGDRGSVLWESFWYPTDTLLPGQSLALDDRSEGKLFSKRADAEFTTGQFSMGIQTDGNVVLYVDLLTGNNAANAYWQEHTNSPDSNTTITFNDHGRLNYTLHNGTVRSLISPASISTAGEYFRFARMDPDGIVRTYARPNNGGGNTSWFVSGAYPSDGCNMWTSGLQGMCGPGSFCVETSDRLKCECPTGYNYTDAQHSDNGCTPGFESQSCGGENSSDEFALEELQNTTWVASIYYKKFSSITEDQCRDHCLSDCFCAAALVTDGGDCAEVAVLTFGRQANDVRTKALIKVRRTSNYPVGASARTTTSLSPYKVVTVCLAFLLVITVGGLLVKHYLSRKRENQRLLSLNVRAFSWKELYQATNGFEKLLGKGSFGEVYQGTIRSPQPRLIAVKKLINSNEYSEKEFTNEVQSIGQIHHRNLVRMIGYCKEGKHRMLVFEFMPGGSLRSFLFNPERRPPWSWRAEAALAIARGLEYLHDGCSAQIIHCDIKPDNILLNDRRVPRITDFGISKLLGSQQVHATVTNVRGTRGCIVLEWLRGDTHVDTKADVYSFGVVLLEMICCRRCQEPVVSDML